MDNQTVISQKRWPESRLSEFRKTTSDYLTRLMVKLLARTSIAPNTVTWFGFSLNLGAAALIIYNYLFAAGFVVIVAGFFDMLDGALARKTDRVTRFGAILDSTLDRVSEAVLLLGIIALSVRSGFIPGIFLASIVLPISLLVSYIRAKAEAMGLECKVGIFTRPERVIVLAFGLLLGQINYGFLAAALVIIILFSSVTVGQRLLYVWRQTKN
ncbi:MAG: CDP-alcohol phosphatidyltransferase family protein [Dehalococcoidales bacterium]